MSKVNRLLDLLAEADELADELISDILCNEVTYDEEGYVIDSTKNQQWYALVDAIDTIEIIGVDPLEIRLANKLLAK